VDVPAGLSVDPVVPGRLVVGGGRVVTPPEVELVVEATVVVVEATVVVVVDVVGGVSSVSQPPLRMASPRRFQFSPGKWPPV